MPNVLSSCKLWEQPNYGNHRNSSLKFEIRTGMFNGSARPSFDKNKSLGRYVHVFILESKKPLDINIDIKTRGMKNRVRLIAPTVIVPVLLVLLSAILCYLRKRRIGLQGDGERRQEKDILREFVTPNEIMGLDGLENEGNRSHNLNVFGFVSIMAATNGFSKKSELGRGGFRLVYKGNLPEG
ncbi:hypothetical protein F0562_011876 [Nyssa sinensis]|uniref:Uncharacterized protein n=1 Tax=Nyssa sinensis TaxID=561372 RepID=A0A5J4ZVQ1_9ASTE|nr:hypothetical protein F0562_011876 [Nyssa sinensis]